MLQKNHQLQQMDQRVLPDWIFFSPVRFRVGSGLDIVSLARTNRSNQSVSYI